MRVLALISPTAVLQADWVYPQKQQNILTADPETIWPDVETMRLSLSFHIFLVHVRAAALYAFNRFNKC